MHRSHCVLPRQESLRMYYVCSFTQWVGWIRTGIYCLPSTLHKSGLIDTIVICWDCLFASNSKRDFYAGMHFRRETVSARNFFFASSFLHASASQLCLKLLCIDKSFLLPIISILLLFPAVNKPLKCVYDITVGDHGSDFDVRKTNIASWFHGRIKAGEDPCSNGG